MRGAWKPGDDIRLRGLGIKVEPEEIEQLAVDRSKVTVPRAWADMAAGRINELSATIEALQAKLLLWRILSAVLLCALVWSLWSR